MTYASEVLADSPAGYWKLQDTSGSSFTDSSGNARTGTKVGSPSMAVDDTATASFPDPITPDDKALQFTAANQAVETALTGTHVGGNSAHTFEGWIRTNDTDGAALVGRHNLAAASPNWANEFLAIGAETGGKVTIRYARSDGSSYTVYETAAIYDRNVWYHVVATYDPAVGAKLYVNGSLVVSGATKSCAIGSSIKLQIGRVESSGNWRTGNGMVMHVAAYTSVLSAARIEAHYDAATSAGTTHDGSAAFSLTASLAAAAVMEHAGAASLSATASLSASPTRVANAGAELGVSLALAAPEAYVPIRWGGYKPARVRRQQQAPTPRVPERRDPPRSPRDMLD